MLNFEGGMRELAVLQNSSYEREQKPKISMKSGEVKYI